MGTSLFVFLISLLIVMLVCLVIAIIKQKRISKNNKAIVTIPFQNDVPMDIEKYSGNWSTVNNIEEVDIYE